MNSTNNISTNVSFQNFFHLCEHDGDELEDDTDKDVDVDADDLYLVVWIWMDSGQDNCILWPPTQKLVEGKEKALYFGATAG